jgi:hypothetical protein
MGLIYVPTYYIFGRADERAADMNRVSSAMRSRFTFSYLNLPFNPSIDHVYELPTCWTTPQLELDVSALLSTFLLKIL